MKRLWVLAVMVCAVVCMAPTCANPYTSDGATATATTEVLVCGIDGTPLGVGVSVPGDWAFSCSAVERAYGCECNPPSGELRDILLDVPGQVPFQGLFTLVNKCWKLATPSFDENEFEVIRECEPLGVWGKGAAGPQAESECHWDDNACW